MDHLLLCWKVKLKYQIISCLLNFISESSGTLHIVSILYQPNPNLIYLNLSHDNMKLVQSLMDNLQTLSLVSNKLYPLESHFFSVLVSLSSLYLANNPLINIATTVFLENPALVTIKSDWHMVCCTAIDIGGCKPQNQFVSSCKNMISSTAQRIIILGQGIIIVVCNAGALVAPFTFVHITSAEKYLIISLVFADMLMGLYLLAIVIVDLIYNMMFYEIVSEWTISITCRLLDLVNFVLSEMTLLVLNILAFARTLSIRQVGGMALLKSKIKAACIFTSAVIEKSGVAYVVYLFMGNIRIQNNM